MITENTSTLTIRPLTGRDHEAVTRLADLDSQPAPSDELLGAEIEGRLLAAISVRTGAVIADPFSRTGELRSLLELRLAQLRQREPTPVGRLVRPAAPVRDLSAARAVPS